MAKLQIFLPDGTQASHDLTDEKTTVGRVADNVVQIDDGSVSSKHAELVMEDGACHIHDLGSTNGTYVNGDQVTDAILRHGDEVRFGMVETVFQGEEEAPEQPLPESTTMSAAVAKLSARPPEFASSSPIPKNLKKKDVAALALYAVAGVAVLAFAAAVVMILGMAVPS